MAAGLFPAALMSVVVRRGGWAFRLCASFLIGLHLLHYCNIEYPLTDTSYLLNPRQQQTLVAA